jgi:hypothetical protein
MKHCLVDKLIVYRYLMCAKRTVAFFGESINKLYGRSCHRHDAQGSSGSSKTVLGFFAKNLVKDVNELCLHGEDGGSNLLDEFVMSSSCLHS